MKPKGTAARSARRAKENARWRWLAWLPGLLLLLALIAVIGHLSEGERLLLLVRRSEPAWLLVAAILQAALRALTYWLPMLPGLWVSRREMRIPRNGPFRPSDSLPGRRSGRAGAGGET